MSLRTACYIAIVLSIGSMFLIFPGYLLNCYPIFKNAPEMAVRVLLTTVAPYVIIRFISIAGWIVLLLSLLMRTRDSRSGGPGLITAAILTGLAAFGLGALSLIRTIDTFARIPSSTWFVYAASDTVCFVSGLLLCLFILRVLQNAAGAVWPALARIVCTILYTLTVIGGMFLTIPNVPAGPLSLLPYVVTYLGIFMAIAADLLVMTAYIFHARRMKSTQSDALSSIPCPAV